MSSFKHVEGSPPVGRAGAVHETPSTWPPLSTAMKLLKTRARLARLTGSTTGLNWEFPMREAAKRLHKAMEDVMDVLFADGMKVNAEWKLAEHFHWSVHAHVTRGALDSESSGNWKRDENDRTVRHPVPPSWTMPPLGDSDSDRCYLTMRRYVAEDGASASWTAMNSDIEAILGLMVWNLKTEIDSPVSTEWEHVYDSDGRIGASEMHRESKTVRVLGSLDTTQSDDTSSLR